MVLAASCSSGGTTAAASTAGPSGSGASGSGSSAAGPGAEATGPTSTAAPRVNGASGAVDPNNPLVPCNDGVTMLHPEVAENQGADADAAIATFLSLRAGLPDETHPAASTFTEVGTNRDGDRVFVSRDGDRVIDWLEVTPNPGGGFYISYWEVCTRR